MGRGWHLRVGLLVIAGAVATLTAFPASAFASNTCSADEDLGGTCASAHITGGGASIGASSGGGSKSDEPAWVPPEGWRLCANGWLSPQAVREGFCRDILTITGPPRPTLSDVRDFYPAATQITSEPQGWALKGRAFNPTADTTPTTRAGTVLGQPTEVTFTPIRWNWDFGDGTTASSTTGGATWAELNQPRFTTTPTSHTYRTRGDYTLQLSVDYTVTYRFGTGPWRPIDGTLTVPAGSLPVRVVVGSTVLTDAPCTVPKTESC